MNTSTMEDDRQSIRHKGNRISGGKIVKGTLNEAPIKLKVSSIPSKYENIVYRSHSQPAFGDSTNKFNDPTLSNASLLPGPNAYNIEKMNGKILSKKGFGFLASSTKLHRLERSRSHIPGPGAYQTFSRRIKTHQKLKLSSSKKSQSFFNKSQTTAVLSSQIQAHDLFKNQINNAKAIPGPGVYTLNPERLKKAFSTNSMFRSKIDRFKNNNVDENPPVGLYEVSQSASKIATKYSKHGNGKEKNEQLTSEKIVKILQQKSKGFEKEEVKQIGPGTYNSQQMNKTAKSFKIKDNMYDRFGELKQIYKMAKTINIQDNKGILQTSSTSPSNHHSFNLNSMFKSKTKRSQLLLAEKMDPGLYNTHLSSTKKSHLINFVQKWI